MAVMPRPMAQATAEASVRSGNFLGAGASQEFIPHMQMARVYVDCVLMIQAANIETEAGGAGGKGEKAAGRGAGGVRGVSPATKPRV